LLLNAGCALRVVLQTLTDLTADSFPFAGVSGVLEVTGLALWGVHLWRIMGRGPTTATETVDPAEPIEASHRVGDVLDRYPDLLSTFLAFGFAPLTNPLLRRTVARVVTIAAACRSQNVNSEKLLAALNIARARLQERRLALNVLSGSVPAADEVPEEGPGCPHCAGRMH
jgi:hypothetical protein